MNWNEYQQQALTTAIYPLKRELEYTTFGLLSEVGELGEAYAESKALGWGFSEAARKHFLSELGDCYWYVAAVADALSVQLSAIANLRDWPATGTRISRGLTILGVVGSSASIAGIVKKAIRDNDGYLTGENKARIELHLHTILVQMDALAQAFGSNRNAVMVNNLNKLADRKARGVLQGSGDNR